MRVFLCGAQGTGKSTLTLKLKPLMLEKRDSFSKSFLDNDSSIQRSTSEKYREFQDKILLYCLNEYVNSNNFIASRSIIDSFAYLTVNKADAEVQLKNLLYHYSDYLFREDDIYVYLPIEFEVSKDNNSNRDIDLQYQRDIDKQISKYFNKFRTTYPKATFITLTGDVESRLRVLEETIIKVRKCLQ